MKISELVITETFTFRFFLALPNEETLLPYSLRASDVSFYSIFLRRFGHLFFTTSSYESDFSWSAATQMVE